MKKCFASGVEYSDKKIKRAGGLLTREFVKRLKGHVCIFSRLLQVKDDRILLSGPYHINQSNKTVLEEEECRTFI